MKGRLSAKQSELDYSGSLSGIRSRPAPVASYPGLHGAYHQKQTGPFNTSRLHLFPPASFQLDDSPDAPQQRRQSGTCHDMRGQQPTVALPSTFVPLQPLSTTEVWQHLDADSQCMIALVTSCADSMLRWSPSAMRLRPQPVCSTVSRPAAGLVQQARLCGHQRDRRISTLACTLQTGRQLGGRQPHCLGCIGMCYSGWKPTEHGRS
jgi:hypothetical protein